MVGYFPGAREPGSHEIFRLTRNVGRNSRVILNKMIPETGKATAIKLSQRGSYYLANRPNFGFLGPFRTYLNGNICPGNICQGDICPCQKYLSCYYPYFDKTLKVDSWDPLELIPTVMATFVQVNFFLVTFVHIRNISAFTDLILTKLQK